MSKEVKRRRGTTDQHSSFTGADGEVTVDTDKKITVVHDGNKQGGFPSLRQDMDNVIPATGRGAIELSPTDDVVFKTTGFRNGDGDSVLDSLHSADRTLLLPDSSGDIPTIEISYQIFGALDQDNKWHEGNEFVKPPLVPDPTASGHAINRGFADGRYGRLKQENTWEEKNTFQKGIDSHFMNGATSTALRVAGVNRAKAESDGLSFLGILKADANKVIDALRNIFIRDADYTGRFESDTFAEAAGIITGAQMDQDTLKIETIRANELRVKAFVAEVSAALYGEDILSKSRGVLSRDFTIGDTKLYVEDLEGLESTAVFENNDWIRLRVIDRSGGGLVVADHWGHVTNYVDEGGGEQSWVWEGLSGGTTGDVIYEGSVAVDYGQSGDSVIIRSVIGDNTPRDTQLTWVTDPRDANNYTIVTRTGNLGGIPNTTGTGFYGENTFLTGTFLVGDLTEAGHFIKYENGNLTMDTPQLVIDVNGDADFSGTLSAPDGDIGGFTIGTNSLSTGINIGIHKDVDLTRNDRGNPTTAGVLNTGFYLNADNYMLKDANAGFVFQVGNTTNYLYAKDDGTVEMTGKLTNPDGDYTIDDSGVWIRGSSSSGGALSTVSRAIRLGNTNDTAEPARIWVDTFVSGVNELVIDNATRIRIEMPTKFNEPTNFNDYIDVPFLGVEPADPPSGSIRIYGFDDGAGSNPDKLFVKFSNGSKTVLASTNL